MYQINKLKHLEIEEVIALRNTLKNDRSRNAIMVQIALETGARSQEVLNIIKSDLDLTNKTLFIRGIKGSNDRDMPIGEDLLSKLKDYIKPLSESDRLFTINTWSFREVWKNYRPCAKKLHSLRHTFAITLFEKHRDIRLVQVALGHRNINNTMVYADYIYRKNELRSKLVNLWQK